MEEHKKPYYKYCVVPMCENNIKSAPDKVYFRMPRDVKMRDKWCKAMKRETVSSLSSLYCCQDHFDIEKDTENLMKYKIMALERGQKVSLLLKKGVVPHIFQCQRKHKLRQPVGRKGVLERNKLALAIAGSSTESTSNISVSPENQEKITQEQQKTTNDLKQVCRVCLAVDVKMYDMRDFELSEMFQNITGIEITANAIMEHLCWECAARLKAAVSFRNKALLSDALLHGLVTTGKEIQKTDITSIKEKYKNIKSNLSVHQAFHIEENGEIVQSNLQEDSIKIEGLKEENILTEVTQNIITDTATPEEESATPENIDTEIEQNRIAEDSIEFEDTIKEIKKENVETEIENDDERMVYIPIKTEVMEVDPFNIKEENSFVDPLGKSISGDTSNSTNSGELVT